MNETDPLATGADRLGGLRGHTRDVLRGSAAAAVAKAATTGISFLFNLLLARQLGAEQTGAFFIAVALASVAAVLSRLGTDKAILKFASKHAAAGEWAVLKTVYIRALRSVTLASVAVVVVLYAGSDLLAAYVFGKPELAPTLGYLSLSVLPLALLNVHAQFLKSIRYIGISLFLQNGAIAGIALAALLFMPAASTAATVGWVYLWATVAACALVAALWLGVSPLLKVRADPSFSQTEIRASSGPLYIVSIVNQIVLPWGAILLLGAWGSEAEAGQFGIARRLAMLISFAYLAVDSITGPKFAALFASNDLPAIRHVARRATVLMSSVAAPLALLLAVAPEWVMGWFGADFTAGAPALVILAVGQLVNALTGSVANLLIMSGHERQFRNITVAAGTANIALAVALIPAFGAVGAAWSTTLAVGGLNLAGLVVVWRTLGFLPFPVLFARSRR
jgi:O-antigen/teichoic acid export membrane protein